MKSKSLSKVVSVAAMAALLPLGAVSARAVSAPTVTVAGDTIVGQGSQFQRVEWKEERKERLRHAYWLIEHADSDYGGHRARAMEHIKKAGEIIGMELHGKDYAQTDQFKSDERMRRARELLRVVAEESGGKEAEHLHEAVHELDHALAAH